MTSFDSGSPQDSKTTRDSKTPKAPEAPKPSKTPKTPETLKTSLDDLCRQAVAGQKRSEAALFSALRERFLTIAKFRVQRDDLEDVVQDALRIVNEKYKQRRPEHGILMWSLVVLRNVIGNYYQTKERRTRREISLEDLPGFEGTAAPEASLEWVISADPGDLPEIGDRILAGLKELSQQNPRCGLMFRRILESWEFGGGAREVSQRALAMIQKDEPRLSRGGFYTALHRCRSRLREIMAEMEERPGHV
jgi:DNA-directed RNA polymerase specialized sigma24 family protein